MPVNPVEVETLADDGITLPPPSTKKVGRPRTQRIRSRGETDINLLAVYAKRKVITRQRANCEDKVARPLRKNYTAKLQTILISFQKGEKLYAAFAGPVTTDRPLAELNKFV
jgi:hypothetical protein